MCDCLPQTIASALWLVFWLLAVDWRKLWPVLRIGGWAPPVLLVVVSAGVWARITPQACTCLQFVTIPNFWWQLGTTSGLATVALFCGWLQGYLGLAPIEHAVEPPEGDDHVHGRGDAIGSGSAGTRGNDSSARRTGTVV
jgi:hypothetical protein